MLPTGLNMRKQMRHLALLRQYHHGCHDHARIHPRNCYRDSDILQDDHHRHHLLRMLTAELHQHPIFMRFILWRRVLRLRIRLCLRRQLCRDLHHRVCFHLYLGLGPCLSRPEWVYRPGPDTLYGGRGDQRQWVLRCRLRVRDSLGQLDVFPNPFFIFCHSDSDSSRQCDG